MERVSNRRENQQRDRVQNKDCAQRYRHFLFIGLQNRTDGGDGAASANRRAGGNQKRGIAAHPQEFSERPPHQQRKGDPQRCVNKSATARFQDFLQIHAETEGHNGTLEESSRDAATVVDVRMRETEAEENSSSESDGRRKQSRERKDDGKNKNDFRECGHRLRKEYQAAHRLSQQEPQSASAKRSSALGAFCVPDSRQRSSSFCTVGGACRCGNSSGRYFSLSFSFAGGAAREDFAGPGFDGEGCGCASAVTILAVAVLLTWQLRS